MAMARGSRAIVVGAGIVGVSTALQLRRAGWETTLLDRGPPGEGCSFGNAGILAGDVVPPVAAPGVLWRVPGYLADAEAPLAIRWGYLPRLLPWLYHFVRCSRPAVYERNTRALATLLLRARACYAPLVAEAGAGALLRDGGALQVFETAAGFQAARRDAAFRRHLGATVEELGPEELRQLTGELAPIFAGALFCPDVGYVRDPLALTRALHGHFLALGGHSRRLTVTRLERRAGGRWGVIAADGSGGEGALEGDRLVVAAGAWSGALLRGLGLSVRLDTERGYHVMLPAAVDRLRLPVSSGEGAFYLTPMAGGLRVAGTVEIGGLAAPPAPARAEAMLRRVRRMLPGLDERGAETWMGFRPSMPDSLPVIGGVEGLPGLLLAFGHAHLGLCLAAVTGRLVTQLAGGEEPELDLRPFRWDRF